MTGLILILIGFVFGQGNGFDARLKKYLDEKLSGFVKYEYQILQAPAAYTRIEINEEKNFRRSKNYAYIPVKVYDTNNFVSASLLTVRIKLFKNVFAASKKIQKNEKLLRSLFIVKIADVSLFEEKTVDTANDLSNFRSKVLIKEGTILSENLIEEIPVVNKGDKLILHAGGIGVDVTIDVVARQDGYLGDVVSVYSNGNKLYKGKIVDKNNLTLVE